MGPRIDIYIPELGTPGSYRLRPGHWLRVQDSLEFASRCSIQRVPRSTKTKTNGTPRGWQAPDGWQSGSWERLFLGTGLEHWGSTGLASGPRVMCSTTFVSTVEMFGGSVPSKVCWYFIPLLSSPLTPLTPPKKCSYKVPASHVQPPSSRTAPVSALSCSSLCTGLCGGQTARCLLNDAGCGATGWRHVLPATGWSRLWLCYTLRGYFARWLQHLANTHEGL